MQSKPPAAGIDGEDSMSVVLGLVGTLYAKSLGEKDISCFERFALL